MERQPHYLVVGADSMVGSALVQRMNRAQMHVTGTTRRRNKNNAASLYLDLSAETINELPSVDVAILCAGVTRLQACKEDPVESAKVNVTGIVSLAEKLHRRGAFVIYLSTNQVFDGSIPFRNASDSTSPVTEYGRQKAEAEKQLREKNVVGAIVRLTKIIGPDTALFLNWAAALQRGESIQAFSDMTLAPVPLSCVVSALMLMATLRLTGTFQISGEEDVSYEKAARTGAAALGADLRLVQGVSFSQSGVDNEPVPPYTTLDTGTLKSTLGIIPPAVQWTVETAFAKPHLLAAA